MVVFIGVVFSSQLHVAYLHLHLQCTKSKLLEFEGMRHTLAYFVGKDRVIQPFF
jgi:hypothetical protein